jgi:hypothetical protein
MGKKGPSYTAGGNASWCNHSGKKIWRLLKNLNIDLPYDPAIPLLGIYPKECDTGYSRDTCTPMFIAVLFIIAKLWKQPRCPTTDEWSFGFFKIIHLLACAYIVWVISPPCPPTLPSLPFTPQFHEGPVLPLSLVLLKKRDKPKKEDKAFLLVELRIAMQKYS